MGDLALGIDVGGTLIKSMIADSGYNREVLLRTPTGKPTEKQEFISLLIKVCERTIEQAGVSRDDIAGIGIGLPGFIDHKNGRVLYMPNINLRDLNVSDSLEKEYNVPVILDNDGQMNAVGEWVCGAGRGVDDLIVITLGTGVGGAVFSGGNLEHGTQGLAGEIGHMVIEHNGRDCPCGQKGCFESYCSASALLKQTQIALKSDSSSMLWELTDNNIENLTTKTIDSAYKQNDALSVRLINELRDYLVTGLASLIHIFNPERILVGGGLSNSSAVTADLNSLVKPKLMDSVIRVDIRKPELSDDAGVYGACAAAFQRSGS